MNEAYFITAGALAERGKNDIPDEQVSGRHLIYSSPATLAFNSPGAQGFGVKRAGLAVPGSVMLLVSPGCCGRNTAALGRDRAYADRFYYLLQDDTDIVTGRHLNRIPEAVKEICSHRAEKPSVVMICITCVDALLGTDMDRVCRKASEYASVPVVPCYMYALTREGRLPPMASVRQSVYQLLEKRPKHADAVNIMGYFSPLAADCELPELLRAAGVRTVRQIACCRTFAEYQAMAEANFNLVLNPEARYAAQNLHERLQIPFIELTRLYRIDKIRNQYALFGQAAGTQFEVGGYEQEAEVRIAEFRKQYGAVTFAVGEWLNGDPFELALALLQYGFNVSEIFGTVGEANFAYVKKLAQVAPDLRIYSNLSPSMLYYDGKDHPVDWVIGQDAMYYHPGAPGIRWNGENQPFGYRGVTGLFAALSAAGKAR